MQSKQINSLGAGGMQPDAASLFQMYVPYFPGHAWTQLGESGTLADLGLPSASLVQITT